MSPVSKPRGPKNFITSKDVLRDPGDQSAGSFPVPASFSASKVSLAKKQGLGGNDQSPGQQSEFLTHSRVSSFHKTHILADYQYGTDEYEDVLQRILNATD